MASFSVFSSRRGLPSVRTGVCALSWPAALIGIAFASMGSDATMVAEPSPALLGGLLLLLAAPTTWLFALVGLAPAAAMALGIVTSLAVWFRLGIWLGRNTASWAAWWRRYVVVALGSMVGITLAVAVAAGFG